MKNVILVTSTNRQPEKLTAQLWAELERGGAAHLRQEGSPDVAFARCMALTAAVNLLRATPQHDVVLMLDDDMTAPLETVQELVTRALLSEMPCSGVYPTQAGTLAACRWLVKGEPMRDHDGRMLWLAGLGCLAIPRARLLELADVSERFVYKGNTLLELCRCGARDGAWWAEDYDLSRRLGGVRLEPLGFGHIKKIPLWPDEETLEQIRTETDLDPSEGSPHVRHHDDMFPGQVQP